MNFDYNEEQQLLADSVRRFLQKDYDFEARRKIVASPEGWSARIWSQLAEMGLTGLPFSPDYGGFGGGAVDLMGVMEAFGEALVVEPYLATIIGAQLVARAGSAEQKRGILPAVVEGRMRLAFAHAERKDGEKLGVVGAPMADKLVISSGVRLFLAERADVKMKPYRSMDNMLAADLIFSKDRAEPMPGADQAIEETTDFATALVCAEAVGANQRGGEVGGFFNRLICAGHGLGPVFGKDQVRGKHVVHAAVRLHFDVGALGEKKPDAGRDDELVGHRRADHAELFTVFSFRVREGELHPAFDDGRQDAPLLFRAARPRDELRAHEGGEVRLDQQRLAEGFHHAHQVHCAAAEAAVVGRERQPGEAHLGELRPDPGAPALGRGDDFPARLEVVILLQEAPHRIG